MKLKAIGGIIAVVILLILCSVVWQNWQTMRVQDFEIHYGFLALSFAAFLLVFFMAAYGWGLGLQALQVRQAPCFQCSCCHRGAPCGLVTVLGGCC